MNFFCFNFEYYVNQFQLNENEIQLKIKRPKNQFIRSEKLITNHEDSVKFLV
jgi:hypothetical protein